MNFELNEETLKQPMTWAVIIPVCLMLATIYSCFSLKKYSDTAKNNADTVQELYETKDQILSLRQELNIGNRISDIKEFDLAEFLISNAKESDIPLTNISAGRISNKIDKRNNSTISKQNFSIRKVDMFRLGKYITKAKIAYADLDCTQIHISRSMKLTTTREAKTGGDAWDVDLSFVYVTPEK
ncbi:MAG: hypothetical protein JEZ07_09270 [Phycisphaerae bacterium]|nr:hypothetical protein [Phycisphaerae bacterium]